MMTRAKFESICMGAVREIKKRAPIKTGNLRNDAIKYEWKDRDTFIIYVDEEIAPYMPFTNEPWESTNHGRWQTKRGKVKKNPNLGWWDRGAKVTINYIARRIKGTIKINEE